MRNIITVQKDKNNHTKIKFEVQHRALGESEEYTIYAIERTYKKDLNKDQQRAAIAGIVDKVAVELAKMK